MLLAGILGGLFACGSVLLREAMLSRNPLPEPITARNASNRVTTILKKALIQRLFLFQEIVAHRRKGIQKGAGLQANAAVHHVRRFIERIARRHDLLFFTYRKLETPRRAHR
ncbi:Uncharacterised protein [Escherichia coli]|nr:Uncharacterised protein [Escherichia coli]